MDFLCRVLEAVIAEGATTINLPDTVGYAVPEGYAGLIRSVRERIPNSDKAIWSVHCHNDLGMAVANSLAAVKLGGARQIECTINGLGERAGNTSPEEVVMAVKTRRDYFDLDVGVDTTQIVPASKLVSQITGFVVQPNKAVVGANAFAHASGIHRTACSRRATPTKSCARRTWAGAPTRSCWASSPAATPSSSACRNWASRWRAKPRSTPPSPVSRNWLTRRPRSSTNIVAIVSDEATEASNEHYRFVSLSQRSETGERPHARVVFNMDGQEQIGEAEGNGPVDATLHAIEGKVGSGAELVLYSVNAITTGTQARARSRCACRRPAVSSTAWAPIPTSLQLRPRPIWPR